MPYNFVADNSHRKKLCNRLPLSEVRFYRGIGRFAFLRPLWGILGQCTRMILDSLEHSRLPISVIEFFFARCYGLGATSDYRFKIGDFAPTGAG